MSQHFFDIHDGSTLTRDTSGIECAGRQEVQNEVVQALLSIARDELPKGDDRQAFMVLVRDETENTVYTATLTFAGHWIADTPLQQGKDDTFN